MLNDMKWKKIDEDLYSLYSDKDGMIAILSYDEYEDIYGLVDRDHYAEKFKSDSTEEAMWRATVKLHDYYNRFISKYMELRDHLPSLGELYDKAFDTIKG